jgi:uncharacterized membrane protein YeaQ/YmgE (transglycosylase-associated protein family)
LIAGLIAGWLTGKLMRGRGYGIFADIILGLVGAVIGQAIFAHLGVVVYGGIGFIAMAVVGALILVAIVHLIRGGDHYRTVRYSLRCAAIVHSLPQSIIARRASVKVVNTYTVLKPERLKRTRSLPRRERIAASSAVSAPGRNHSL